MILALPADAAVAALWPLEAGTGIVRNHHVDYPGARFNPCLGEPTQFAPLRTGDGVCIPTFYAATTFDAAGYETVFCGAPGPYAAVPRQELEQRGVSAISPRSDLWLVPFFTPELRAMGLDEAALFRPSAGVYAFCRELAAKAWRDNADAHGIVWSSVRDSAAQAMLFFGDRVAEADFALAGTRTIASDGHLLEEFVAAAARAGFRISR